MISDFAQGVALGIILGISVGLTIGAYLGLRMLRKAIDAVIGCGDESDAAIDGAQKETRRSIMTMKWWVGVLKGEWENHKVFEFDGDPSEEDCPDCDYVIGPFDQKKDAEDRAKSERNQTGMFTDPFGPQPYGR